MSALNADSLLLAQQIEQLLARGAVSEAAVALENLLRAEPKNRHALMRAVDVQGALRDHARALTHADALLALDPADLDAHFYVAKAAFSAGDVTRAAALVASLATTPASRSAAFQFLSGNVAVSQSDFAAAEAAFAKATTLDPTFAGAWLNLGALQKQLRKLGEARASLTHAVKLAPHAGEAWKLLADANHAAGALADAREAYARAVATDNTASASTWMAYGNVLVELFDFAAARDCFERVLAQEPTHEDARSVLGFVLAELGETAQARAVLESAGAASSATLSRQVRAALLLPQIYADRADLNTWRSRYVEGLVNLETLAQSVVQSLVQSPVQPSRAADIWRLAQTNFLLAYQGENDLEPQTRYADFLRTLLMASRPDLLAPMPRSRLTGARIKVAFVSSYFRECTIGHYFRSWIEQLDAGKFERVVVATGGLQDAVTQQLASACDRFVPLRAEVEDVATAIRELSADVLIYPEVGMGAQNYLLANLRLAPIQIAAWGHPVTTGSREIDFFLTCGEMEPADAAQHYRERPLLLPGIGTTYAIPAVPDALARERIGIGADRHVYVCPQSLFKVHPDNDDVFCDILQRDERAVLLFFQAAHAPVTRQFSARLSARMQARGLAARGQVKFLPRMDARTFRAVLAMADVVLDTLHWSGGNTSLDAIAAGTPIVTLPGRLMRGRQTAAMLRAMDGTSATGLSELIVADQNAYVREAVAVARDTDKRDALRQMLRVHRDALFARTEPIRALEAHLVSLVENNL